MIRFINHACFMVSRGQTALVCDPWIAGTAFDDGWKLITETAHPALDAVTHIWYSHEHPDHFSIGFLRSIPEARRQAIEVLYQRTADRRVARFCAKLGFRVRELDDGAPVALGDDIRLTIGRVPFYDSWACIETPEYRLLNSNDCILEKPERLKLIRRHVSSCDILFTQFSYANWQDSRSNPAARRALAAEKLARIKLQCDAFKARFVVPFASFVYFSHAENDYMNADINTPETAVDYIAGHCDARPVLLQPNEEWDGRTAKSNRQAIAFWQAQYASALAGQKQQPGPSVPILSLIAKADAAITRVRAESNYAMIRAMQVLRIIRPAAFLLTDMDRAVTFDWVGGLRLLTRTPADAIRLHSSSLAFIFDNDFGVDTVNVNARFEADMAGKRRMLRLFSVLALRNTGRNIRLRDIDRYLNLPFLRQGLRTVGLFRSA